jgi:hypothetical protein
MADQISKPSPYYRYGVLVVIVALLVWNYFQEKKPMVKTGKLEFRMVTGVRDNQLQVILIETSDRYVILDSAYRQVLVSEDGELISRAKQLRMLEKYQDIGYRAGFAEQPSGLKPCYRVTRELFNSLKFGEPLKYEVNKKQKDSLSGFRQ